MSSSNLARKVLAKQHWPLKNKSIATEWWDSYGWDFYYAWVQILLQMGPLLHLGPVITLMPSTNSQIPTYTTNDKASRT